MWHRVANAVFIRFSEQWVVLVTQRVVNLICRARNAFGSVTRNYSLEVSSLGLLASMDSSPASGASVVVTGISPRNSSLQIGQSGRLSCSVRSHETPHIKWLKQVPIWIFAPKLKNFEYWKIFRSMIILEVKKSLKMPISSTLMKIGTKSLSVPKISN